MMFAEWGRGSGGGDLSVAVVANGFRIVSVAVSLQWIEPG